MSVVSENNMAEAREQKINMISTLERSELPPYPSPVKGRWLLGAYWEHIQQTNQIKTSARVLTLPVTVPSMLHALTQLVLTLPTHRLWVLVGSFPCS